MVFLVTAGELHERGVLLQLAAIAARFAHTRECEDMRVLVWDREPVLHETLDTLPGWGEVERDVDVALDLTANGPATAAPSRPAGIQMTTLAQRADLASSAYECLAAAVRDIPGDEPQVLPAFEVWERDLARPTMRPDAIFLAVDQATDDVLGFAVLEFPAADPSEIWNGYTAVHPDARGRGIAFALKHEGIAFARGTGAVRLRTENEQRNAPMRHINERLGYAPIAQRVHLRGPAQAVLDAAAVLGQSKGV
jgi:GNAT superfamily N-acetyltransferase